MAKDKMSNEFEKIISELDAKLAERMSEIHSDVEEEDQKEKVKVKTLKEEDPCEELIDAANLYFRLAIREHLAAAVGIDISQEENDFEELEKNIKQLSDKCQNSDAGAKAEELVERAKGHRAAARKDSGHSDVEKLVNELEQMN
jgi:hypothetical protein